VRSFFLIVAFVAGLLGFVGSAHAQDPLNALLKELDSKRSDRRADALTKLTELGSNAAPATDHLVKVLLRLDDYDRHLAVTALGAIGKPAIPALEKLLTHEDELARHDAVWALGLIGPDARGHAPHFLKLARFDPDKEVRAKAILALSRIDAGNLATMRALLEIGRDKQTDLAVKYETFKSLPRWGEAAIVEALAAQRFRFGDHADSREVQSPVLMVVVPFTHPTVKRAWQSTLRRGL
jgi:hypothetical protein